MRRRSLCALSLTVILSLLLQAFPTQTTFAQEPVAPPPLLPLPPVDTATTPPPSPPQPITVPPLADAQLPSLSLRVQSEPLWAAAGDLVTTTLTVFNQAPFPADDLTLTLPLPAEARPLATAPSFANGTQQWKLASLAPGAQTVFTTTLRLERVPPGEALLLQPSAIARGLTTPVTATGGVLVTTTPQARPGSFPADAEAASTVGALATTAAPAAPADDSGRARFVPGQLTRLRTADGRITVEVPPTAFDRPLTLLYRTPAQQRPLARARGQQEPPEIAGLHRGFGTFHLEATDDNGVQVKHFKQRLRLAVQFTPQQLQVLGLSAENLRLFWFDEDQVLDRGKGGVVKGAWVPQLTRVDAAAGTATLEMDHFSAFQLSDGSSPSAAYLPSLQGWQVSGFTGAASFTYPFDLPAGPGGLKPALSLSYSSAATDGAGGMRPTAQAGWVGKGWSLDTGSVALNKLQLTPYSTVNHYALSFGGRSYTLMRAESLVGAGADPNNPTHWAWRPTDESYIRVRVVQSGVSSPGSAGTPGRGAWDYSTALPRYTWQVWDRDGTRYDFAEDVWWLWAKCSGTGAFAQSESNRWLLSQVTDTSGNTITYHYSRLSQFHNSCMGQSGTVDLDIWPSQISWADDRYRVEFLSSARSNDTGFDWPEYTVGGPVRETRRLDAVRVWSKPGDSWQLMRQYNLGYDYSLRSDARICTSGPNCSTWGADNASPKLTLRSVQRIANDGQTALPALSFSYSSTDGSGYHAAGGWNRLSAISNGQGGSLSLSYANIVHATGNGLFVNRHRVTTRTESDGRGTSYPWSYSYGTPQVNTLGTSLRPDDPSAQSTPTSAALYYNVFRDGDADFDQEAWLLQRTWTEFRGHSSVTEIDPSGAQTRRSFIQGNAGCVPAAAARGSDAAIFGDSCFAALRTQEFLKGREWRTEQLSSSGARLAETVRSYQVGPVDYSWAPLSGLWRAFSYESAVDETAWEGGATPSTKRSEYFYNLSCSWSTTLDAYGRLGCLREYDRGTLVRKTLHAYASRVDASSYIVDRRTGTSVFTSADQYLAHTLRFYDDNNQSLGSLGTRGLLTREISIWNLNGRSLAQLTSQQLDGRDTTYGYDSWGNRITESSYAGGGWVRWTGSVWQASAPGNGSTARTTTTDYDPTFHALPTTVSNALGHVERAGYDYRMGTLTSVTDANNQTTTAGYDGFGRFTGLVKPGDNGNYPTSWAWYYDWEQPVRVVLGQREDAGQGTWRPSIRSYDGLGRLIQTKTESQEGAQQIVSDTRYDGLGRIVQQSQPRYVDETPSTTFWVYTPTPMSGVNWTTTSYDALGRLSSVSEPDGAVSRSFYSVSPDGRRVTDVVDAEQHRTQSLSDALGRRTASQEISGDCGNYWGYRCGGTKTTPWAHSTTTSYSYTPLDLLGQLTDAHGNTTTLTYDSLGRKTAMSDADMGSWSYGYDANGNLTSQRDAKGQTISFAYDALNRLTSKSSAGWVNAYAYDQALGFGIGRRTGMLTAVNGQTQSQQIWAYDARGRVAATTSFIGAAPARGFGYSYDSADRLRSISYPQGETLNYGYDAAWRQSSVCTAGTVLGNGCYAAGVTYTADDQPSFLRMGNSATTRWSYDPLSARLSQLQVGTDGSWGQLFNRSYGYDVAGNVTSIGDQNSGQTQTFVYDHRDRLSSWTAAGVSQSYSYDLLGNLTSKGGGSR